MKNRFRRVVAAFSLVALGSVIAAAPATAADPPTGVSNSGGGLTLVSVDYGDILKATLAGESSSNTIDPAIGVPTASEALGQLTVKSVLIPALDALSVTPVQTTSTGAADEKTTTLLDLSTLGAPGIVGSINPATLASVVDTEGAKSFLSSTLAGVHAIGVLGVDSASITFGGKAGPTTSVSDRVVSIDALTVLDLQALLNMFGLSIDDLPLDTITSLLDQLGEIPLLGGTFTDAASIDAAINDANVAIDDAQAALQDAVDQLALLDCALVPALCATLNGAINGALQDAVDNAQGLLDDLLSNLLDVLSGTPLVSIEGINAGAFAKAADTLANSAASVTAGIEGVHIGGLDFGPISADATLDQLAGIANVLNTSLNDVLTSISPELANVLSFKLFERSTNTFEDGGYVNALAGITALSVTITPPNLCALLSDLPLTPLLPEGVAIPASPVSDLLESLGSGVDFCLLQQAAVQPAAIGQNQFPALTGPLTVNAATVSSAANFKVVASPSTPETPTGPQLPRTGTNEILLLVVGGLMAAAALGLRRVTAVAKATSRRR